MLIIFWFLLISLGLASVFAWMLDNQGSVIITWLGYEIKTDVLTALLISAAVVILVAAVSYLAARILAIRFPNLLRSIFKKSYSRRLEALVYRHRKSLDEMIKLLLALEAEHPHNAADLEKKLEKLLRFAKFKFFFLGKIAYQEKDFTQALNWFLKLEESFAEEKNEHLQFLILKVRMLQALEAENIGGATSYARKILAIKTDDAEALEALKQQPDLI